MVVIGNEDVIGFWLKMMVLNDFKWYDIFFFLIGVILSFVDVVIDVFIVIEYYKENYRRWFKWGVVFMIVFCLFFVVVSMLIDESLCEFIDIFWMIFFIFNLFFFVWVLFKVFFLCLKNFKKFWCGEDIDCEDYEIDNVNCLIRYVKFVLFMEIIIELVF